nr:EAL domain-containing protein [uncultured Lichenicoccus sp.]
MGAGFGFGRGVPVSAKFHRLLLKQGGLVNLYQPIVNLGTGKLDGVEILCRLQNGSQLIPPGDFLPSFGIAELDTLLFQSLVGGIATLLDCSVRHPDLRLSVNVHTAVLTYDGFGRRLIAALRDHRLDPRRITLEILEGHEFLDLGSAFDEIHLLRDAGVEIALDDVGSGYSTLKRLRELPVDSIKLDQAFVRGVLQKPDDLQFVASMVSLARGLRKKLVVEGVENAEIANALQVLGVGLAQGYEIARPMPSAMLLAWSAALVETRGSREPDCMLGAYAAHLVIVETCHMLMNQAIGLPWPVSLEDPHVCAIGRYLDLQDLHHTPLGDAHKIFHLRIAEHGLGVEAWQDSAERLRRSLERAVVRGPELPVAASSRRRSWRDAQSPGQGFKSGGCNCHPALKASVTDPVAVQMPPC